MNSTKGRLILRRGRGGQPHFACKINENNDRIIYFYPTKIEYEPGAVFVKSLTIDSNVFFLNPEELAEVRRVFDESRLFIMNFYDSLIYDSIYPAIRFLDRFAVLRLLPHERERLQKYIVNVTYVYLIRDKTTGLITIGRSNCPESRLKQLVKQDTLMPQANDFEFVFYWKTYESTERLLHGFYAEKRVRGEWFELTEQDIAEIKHFHFDRD